jgi:hypothetical protein
MANLIAVPWPRTARAKAAITPATTIADIIEPTATAAAAIAAAI